TTIIQPDTTDTAHDILDLGGDGFWEGYLVIDVAAIEVASGDEIYSIVFQLSNSASFTSSASTPRRERVVLRGGAELTAPSTGSVDSTPGRSIVPVNTEYGGVVHRYCRLVTQAAGSLASGLTFPAFLAPRRP